jgi:hypothetical protein
MAAKATRPGIPRKPDTADVKILMGTWSPYRLPPTFKKNSSKAPINSFIIDWPKNLIGLNGAPENNSNKIRPPKIEIT